MPGRKADVKDREWLADLAHHSLIAKSFVPPKPLRQLRDPLRYRRKLMESRTAGRNWLLKLLETANIESAGKQQRVGARKGNVHLRTAPVEAAVAASQQKCSDLKDKFYRLRSRRGTNRAAMAIGHKILIAAYHMLSTGIPCKDLGATYPDGIEKRWATRNLVRRLERLCYEVTLEHKAAQVSFPTRCPASRALR